VKNEYYNISREIINTCHQNICPFSSQWAASLLQCLLVIHMTALLLSWLFLNIVNFSVAYNALRLPIPITVPALNHNNLSLSNKKCSWPQYVLWKHTALCVAVLMYACLTSKNYLCIWTEFVVQV